MEGEALSIVQKVHSLFKREKLTLAVAESCTGGLISHYLTDLPGASVFFIAGVVSYSGKMKEKILGVSRETMERRGVVSEGTAREMAEGVRTIARTHCSLSSTGNLGPDVIEGKEKGLIYLAACKEGKTFTMELRLKGDRESNKKDAALKALEFLVKVVERDETLNSQVMV